MRHTLAIRLLRTFAPSLLSILSPSAGFVLSSVILLGRRVATNLLSQYAFFIFSK